MVIAQRIPKTMCVIAIQNPPIRIQMIFMIIARKPEADSFSLISLPKGARARREIFIHCTPKGIPIIVQHKTNPAIRYSRKRKIPPPKIIHKMFPNKLIFTLFTLALPKVLGIFANVRDLS